MKNILLAAASLLALLISVSEAWAVPAFARQTGMDCNGCHQQHVPILNSVGQAFKAGGYTMVGAQDKLESEGLSIPSTLNAAILLKARYQKTNGIDAPNTISGTTTNGGQWQIPDEMSLFFGGRIAENIGFISENNFLGGPAGGIEAGFKIPFVFDQGWAKLSVIPYMTDALGVAYGFEQSSTGMAHGIRWAEHAEDTSAPQYVGIGSGAASGLAFVAHSDLGYINWTRWSPNFTFTGDNSVQMRSNWLRIAATPTIAGWAMHFGLGVARGTNYIAPATLTSQVTTRATAFDFQAFGQLGGKDLGVYATSASAPTITPVPGNSVGNIYGFGLGGTTKAHTIGAEYSVIPQKLHLGAAYRNAKNGDTLTGLQGDNSITVTVVYNLKQNVNFHFNHSHRSGSSYRAGGANDTSVAGKTGNKLTTLMLVAAF